MSPTRIHKLSEISSYPGITSFYCNCPFCEKDGRTFEDGKLGIDLEKDVYHCYRCERKGRASRLLKRQINNKTLLEITNNRLWFVNRPRSKKQKEVLVDIHLEFIGTPVQRSHYQYKYLKNRNIDDKLIEKYGILSGLKNWEGYAIFPLYDKDNKLVSYIGRNIENNDKLRYKYPVGFSRSTNLFNINNVNKGDNIIVCEGVFDAIEASKIPGYIGVALLGKFCSLKQALLICEKEPKKLILALDKDTSYKERKGIHTRLSLTGLGNIKELSLPEKDISDLGWKKAEELIKKL